MQEIESKNKQVKLLMDQLRDLITDVAMWQSPCSVWSAKLGSVCLGAWRWMGWIIRDGWIMDETIMYEMIAWLPVFFVWMAAWNSMN